MSWFSRAAPLVRVRRPRPANLQEVRTLGEFNRVVHEAEGIERNSGKRGEKRQMVEVWIEVAGEARRSRIELLGGLVSLRGPVSIEWEDWACFYRGPDVDATYPDEADIQRALEESGAYQARATKRTIIKLH